MFEAAEVGRKLSKPDYAAAVPALRTGLLEAQRALRQAGAPVVVVISGADGAGKGETVNRLVEWLDPRGVETNVFGPLSDEERDRPPYWRFWRTLPAAGRIGIFFGSWYTDPIVRRAHKQIRAAEFDAELERIGFFERMLAAEGTLIVKFWLHLSKKAQRRRLETLEADRRTRWRVTRTDWQNFALYDRFKRVSERALRRTDSGSAPWNVVEATDDRYREVTVAGALLAAMRQRLEPPPAAPAAKARASAPAPVPAGPGVLDKVDLSRRVSERDYERQLARLQGRLSRLARRAHERGLSTVALFEGWDAAGKGGAIRRITEAIDARLYRVVPIAAPTDEERAHHYLWRFWRHIPRAGYVTVFDRTWYGRVLVERVEGFAREAQWRRAYLEINDFEEQLTRHGIVLLKFWLHVSPEEQLRRFKDRQRTAYKQHKITDEDWRNRKQWPLYVAAVNEMVVRTSTPEAPWTLVSGDDKRVARLEILETLVGRLEKAL